MKIYVLVLLCWFISQKTTIAKAPAQDIDSITEDSYQRMLKRQASELESDSLRVASLQLELTESSLKKTTKKYYLIAGLIVVLVFGMFWYVRPASKISKSSNIR